MDIVQMPNYIEISCKDYITHLLKSHELDTESSIKSIPEEAIATCLEKVSQVASNLCRILRN